MPSFTPSPSSTPSLTPRKASTAAQSRSPVSLRLYKVLGTNFDDEATREALRTLSDLYATPSHGKGKAVQRGDDELDGDDEESRVRSKDATELPSGESAAHARRNLRKDMEQKLAEGSRHFLAAFGEVDQVNEYLCGSYGLLISYHRNLANSKNTSTLCIPASTTPKSSSN